MRQTLAIELTELTEGTYANTAMYNVYSTTMSSSAAHQTIYLTGRGAFFGLSITSSSSAQTHLQPHRQLIPRRRASTNFGYMNPSPLTRWSNTMFGKPVGIHLY